jgi:hypothetical protein
VLEKEQVLKDVNSHTSKGGASANTHMLSEKKDEEKKEIQRLKSRSFVYEVAVWNTQDTGITCS